MKLKTDREGFKKYWEEKREKMESKTVEQLRKQALGQADKMLERSEETFQRNKKRFHDSQAEDWEKEMGRKNCEKELERQKLLKRFREFFEKELQSWNKKDLMLHLLEHRKGLDLRRALTKAGFTEEETKELVENL